MISYDTTILWSWLVFLLVWGIGAFVVKRDVRGGGAGAFWSQFVLLRLAVAVFIVFVVVRLGTGTAQHADIGSLFSRSLFVPPAALGWVAAALVVLGVAFAIWARLYLGRNWSASPAVKEHHELVTGGPYAFVRHPIYTGVMLAALGSSVTGTIFGIGMFILIVIMFSFRLDKEERIMLELFPNEYPAYQARTKRLIPFIW